MSALRPVLTEFITKKMSGGEEKQGDRRRSAEGQCTKHSHKVKLREESYCCCSSVNWKVLDGDMGGGIGISDYVFEAKRIEELEVQPQWKMYSLICEKHCVTVGSAQSSGVITGI